MGKDLILVSPLTCLERLLALMVRPDFWGIVAGSLGRILAGFFWGWYWGSSLPPLQHGMQFLYPLFSLPMNIIRATPVASFAILALLFLSGPGFSIFIAFLMVLPLVWSNVHEGLTHLDPQLLEMARVFRLPRSAVLKQIIFPSTLPYLLSAVRWGWASVGKPEWRERSSPFLPTPLAPNFITPRYIWKPEICSPGQR